MISIIILLLLILFSIEVSDVVSVYVAITTAVADDLVLACTVTINLAFF